MLVSELLSDMIYFIHSSISVINTYIETFRKQVSKNSLYIAMDINRLSLNSDGALRTIIHRRTPQPKNRTSTENRRNAIMCVS